MIKKFKIIKITAARKETLRDSVVREVPLILIVNGKELTALLCSPGDLEDLARGFLFSSGWIKSNNDIKGINIDKRRHIGYVELMRKTLQNESLFKRMRTGGGGKGILFYKGQNIIKSIPVASTLTITRAKITVLMNMFLKSSPIYARTGGTHSAAIANADTIEALREDIGRHNAVDKVIGWGLKNNCDFSQKILAASGRISLEVILKMERCGIPIVISKSAPTDEAVKQAKASHITLIGFVRADSMNVYSCARRIKWNKDVFL